MILKFYSRSGYMKTYTNLMHVQKALSKNLYVSFV